jgi:hypothetical protein
MPVFEVRAITKDGDDADGWVSARDFEDCNSKLLAKGFFITAVRRLNPWHPAVKPGRLNSGYLESMWLWVRSVFQCKDSSD